MLRLASAILGLCMLINLGRGIRPLNVKSLYIPKFTDSFDQAAVNYKPVYDMVFGTDVLETSSQIAIRSLYDLDDYFNPLESGTDANVINSEIQRYPAAFNTTNTDFVAGSLDLKATANAAHLPLVTMNPTAVSSYSRTITVANTSVLKVGQVLGFGTKSYSLMHTTITYDAGTAVTTGDTLTQTITDRNATFSKVITVTATVGQTVNDVVAALVAAINADSTLSSKNIKAYALPHAPRAYAITWPKRTEGSDSDFGFDANGSFEFITTSGSATGTIANALRQKYYPCHILSIDSGTQITVSHPVTLATSDTLYFNPVYMFGITQNHSNQTVLNVAGNPLAAGITVGQVGQFSYQDNNIRAVTAVSASTITFTNGTYMYPGLYVTIYPIGRAVTTATTSNATVLTFASVPAIVQAGMVYFNLFGSPNFGKIKVVSKTATTVTLDKAVTIASGDTAVFIPEIDSGQAWSKFLFSPQADGRSVIAFELTAEVPNNAAYAAWPAFWLFPDSTDPSPINPSGASYELDFPDLFTYWNNASSGNYIGTGSSGTDTYLHPDWVNGSLTGNNTGIKERKFGLIWTGSKVFYYLDGVLVRARDISLNPKFRAQLGFNLAVGSIKTAFNSNGYFPVDASQFPMRYKIKRMRMLANKTDKPLDVDQLALGNNLIMDLYSHDPDGLFTQKSGTSILQLNDRRGRPNNAGQGTAGRYPLTGTMTKNGRNVWAFDGNNDGLTISSADMLTFLNSGVDATILLAVFPEAGGTYPGQNILTGQAADGTDILSLSIDRSTGITTGRWTGTYVYDTVGGNIKDGSLHVVGMRRMGGNFQVYADGVWSAARVSNSGVISDITFGNSRNFWNGYMGEIGRFCVWKSALSDVAVEEFRQRMILEWS